MHAMACEARQEKPLPAPRAAEAAETSEVAEAVAAAEVAEAVARGGRRVVT